jgi:hypothetical protein
MASGGGHDSGARWARDYAIISGMPDVPVSPEVPVTPEQPAAGVEQSSSPELSSVEADEQARETLAETQDDVLHAEQKPELEAAEEAVKPSTTTAASTAGKDEVVIEVEKILEDGIGPFYKTLPEEAKPLFKQKGEEASRQISEMVRTMHVQVKRVLELIHAWLKTIPGVNKFFLEQEAKIKTDRIVALAEERRREAEQK